MAKKKSEQKKTGRSVSNNTTNEKLKNSLINASKIIKKKFRDLHNERISHDLLVHEEYKPIIEPLQFLANRKKTQDQVKQENNNDFSHIFKKFKIEEQEREDDDDDDYLSASSFQSSVEENEGKDLSGIEELPSSSVKFNEKTKEPIKRIDDMLGSAEDRVRTRIQSKTTDNTKIDARYGIRNVKGNPYLGKELVKTTNNGKTIYYVVNGREYEATPGLTNLLLLRNPKKYNTVDLDNYKTMLIQTNAHRSYYRPKGRIQRNPSSVKYRSVIKKLFPPKKKAGSTLQMPQLNYKIAQKRGEVNYSYWDDPNELVDRLRLLIASQAAGHTGHNNEIISIVEELREAKIIK